MLKHPTDEEIKTAMNQVKTAFFYMEALSPQDKKSDKHVLIVSKLRRIHTFLNELNNTQSVESVLTNYRQENFPSDLKEAALYILGTSGLGGSEFMREFARIEYSILMKQIEQFVLSREKQKFFNDQTGGPNNSSDIVDENLADIRTTLNKLGIEVPGITNVTRDQSPIVNGQVIIDPEEILEAFMHSRLNRYNDEGISKGGAILALNALIETFENEPWKGLFPVPHYRSRNAHPDHMR